MAKSKEEIKQTLEEDLQKFQGRLDYYKTHRIKALNPKVLNEIIASGAIVSYLNERLKLFEDLEV